MDLKEVEKLEGNIDSHWYYQSKARALVQILHGKTFLKVLDVGAGSGFFSKFLLKHSLAVEAHCIDIGYVCDSMSQISGKNVYFKKSINHIDANLVLLMDVLEHVDNDVDLLKEYASKVPPGATFVITVPAFQFLWSKHDIFLEHKRRYTLAQLESVVNNSGLRKLNSGYIFGLIFPIACAIRLVTRLLSDKNPSSQLSKHNKITNTILRVLCRIEEPFIGVNRLFGLSVYCVAVKV
jgi:SAM-dependent methyltransferase